MEYTCAHKERNGFNRFTCSYFCKDRLALKMTIVSKFQFCCIESHGCHCKEACMAALTLQPLTETECGTQSELFPNHKEKPHCDFHSS